MKKKKNNFDSPVALPPGIISPWLNIKEAATYLHVGVKAVRRYTHRGELTSHQPGKKLLYKVQDLEAFMEKNKLEIDHVPKWATV